MKKVRVRGWRTSLLLIVLPVGLALSQSLAAEAASFYGDDGPDDFIGTANEDLFWTYAGNDDVDGKAGNDEIHLGADNDDAWGSGGDDIIYGGDSTASAPGDRLRGGDGADFLRDVEPTDREDACGGDGNDILLTDDGDGNDLLVGGGGTDTLDGDPSDDEYQGTSQPCPR